MKNQDLFSAVIHVRYYCAELHSEFMITGVSGNQAQGIFTLNEIRIPVSVYRHSDHTKQRGATNIWFAGSDIDPNEFVGGTGRYEIPEAETGLPAQITLGGAFPNEESIQTFIGTYLRMD